MSAPYENGIGAVYVYMGSKGGLLSKYSQKIVPSDFKMIGGPSPKGFGLGLSRGNDIDGNGHNGTVNLEIKYCIYSNNLFT